MSIVERPRRKPHWVSGSIISATCVRSWLSTTLAKILPPTDNSEMPRLLPQSARSPLFSYRLWPVAYEAGGGGRPPAWKNSVQICFQGKRKLFKILNDKKYFNAVKILGQTLFFSGSASCSKILNVKKYIQYS